MEAANTEGMGGADCDPFSRVRLLVGNEAAEAIAGMRVAVFGLGGVGGWCAEALVRSGVGRLMLVDDDRVAPSNINRQLPATARTIGMGKVEVLLDRFRAINPRAEIEARAERYTPESAGNFDLASFDFVVDAIDSVECKAHLLRTAAALEGVEVFSSMGAGARIDPSRIRASRFSKVEGDGLARALRRRFRRDGWPARDFVCVWSDEPPRNLGARTEADGLANGSIMPVTATFGLRLASLVLGTPSRSCASSC